MVLYSFVLERPDTGQQIIHYLNNSFLSLSLSQQQVNIKVHLISFYWYM